MKRYRKHIALLLLVLVCLSLGLAPLHPLAHLFVEENAVTETIFHLLAELVASLNLLFAVFLLVIVFRDEDAVPVVSPPPRQRQPVLSLFAFLARTLSRAVSLHIVPAKHPAPEPA